MSNERIKISRRKALVGLGSIGLASAGAGIGTYAQFTDEEENSATFTAGGIDGKLSWSGSYNGNEVDGQLENVKVSDNTVSGDVHFTDVKPGDYGCVNFGIEVDNNPAWVASCLDVTENIDNRVFEPEVKADDDVDSDQIGDTGVQSQGELAQNMLTLPYYDSDGSCTFFDSGGPVAPEDPENVLTASEFWSNTQDEDDPKFPPVGEAANDGQRYYLAPRTVNDVSKNLQSIDTARWTERGQSLEFIEAPNGTEVGTGCVMLEGDSADGNDTSNNTQGVSPLQPDATLNFGYDFHLPFELTGNAVQGDRMTLSFGFKFLQVRHTEAPNFGSYSPGSNTPNNTDTQS
jgi:predicted ribosomally synthesized peptide with SipW-like signal peptide